MFNSAEHRFSPAMSVVTALSHQEAERNQNGYVSYSHWLLGLSRHPEINKPLAKLRLTESSFRALFAKEPDKFDFVKGSMPVLALPQPTDALLYAFRKATNLSRQRGSIEVYPSDVLQGIFMYRGVQNLRLTLEGTDIFEEMEDQMRSEGDFFITDDMQEKMIINMQQLEISERYSARASAIELAAKNPLISQWLTESFTQAFDYEKRVQG